VLAAEVIEHLPEPRTLLCFARRLLVPGGRLILTTPYHGYAKNLMLSMLGAWDRHFSVETVGGHVRFFSRRTLTAMVVSHGFRALTWQGLGRAPYLWKSMLLVAQRS
jgi:2-polyprenyl-3-methyl-5-hydroxy-6-metoxy-1,4-benzoquinol methylase